MTIMSSRRRALTIGLAALFASGCTDDLTAVAAVQGRDASRSGYYHESFGAVYAVRVNVWGSWYGYGDPNVCWTLYGPGSQGSTGMRCGNETFSPLFLANDLWIEPYGDPTDEVFVEVLYQDPIEQVNASCSLSGEQVSCTASVTDQYQIHDTEWQYIYDGNVVASQYDAGPGSSSSWTFNYVGTGTVLLSYYYAEAGQTQREVPVEGAPPPAITALAIHTSLSGTYGVIQQPAEVWVSVTPRVAGIPISFSYGGPSDIGDGGHGHAGRPGGTFSPASGVTNSNGSFTTTYTSREFSGSEMLVASGGGFSDTAHVIFKILPVLGRLDYNAHITETGGDCCHTRYDSHSGTAVANNGLIAIADEYGAAFDANLVYNDQSLPWGGRFDINGTWGGSHVEHRFGNNCDVQYSSVPSDRKDFVEQLFIDHGSGNFKREFALNHWHLRFGP